MHGNHIYLRLKVWIHVQTMIFVLKCLLYQCVLTSVVYIVNYELFQAANYILFKSLFELENCVQTDIIGLTRID